ncbi:MAG: SDR family NAD(P)-dependent oxidoreductase [Pirellulales bacterium]
MEIRDSVAVVTGGASGIGEAVAWDLAKRQARTVALVDRTDRVHEVAQRINGEMGREVAVTFIGDVTCGKFRQETFDQIEQRHGVARICIPAAGITKDGLAVKIDKQTGKPAIYAQETFDQVISVNMTATTYWALEAVSRIAAERFRKGLGQWEPAEEAQGAIVFIGSVSSQGNKGQIAYAASKAGLEGIAATLSKEAIYYGVRCAVIHPGFTDTPMVRALGEEMIQKHILPFTRLRRLIRPAEIADAICFLISNSAVSGELWVDAGWHPPA